MLRTTNMRRVAIVVLTTSGASSSLTTAATDSVAETLLFGKVSVPFAGSFHSWLSETAFSKLDINSDGELDESELGSTAIKLLDIDSDGRVLPGELTLSKAKALFDALDLDGDGELTASELPEEIISLVENHDGFEENNDGKVDTVEFSNWHASQAKKQQVKRSMSWTEILILCIAFGGAVVAVGLMVQSWRKTTSSGSSDGQEDFMGVEEYELDYPPEVGEFQALRDAGEQDEAVLKRALMKRALATVPMRVYVQVEERNVQRLYQNSMISPATWNNFQACVEEVKAEMEVLREEAEALKEGWGESLLQEAHWLHQHIEEEKKHAEMMKEAMRMKTEAAALAKREADAKAVTVTKSAEQELLDREKAIKELEKEAERMEAEKQKKQGGLTQRKNSSGKKK
mmetsp:Transcript_32363/g.59183  ORF Transcript_32363/g.59183 Transcript_32363/m.59183 type:complete len:401 (-) Transcript_32363:263-1465(-)